MKNKKIGVPTLVNGKRVVLELVTNKDITDLFRSVMIRDAFAADELLSFDETTGRAKRIEKGIDVPQPEPVTETKREMTPELQLINKKTVTGPSGVVAVPLVILLPTSSVK